MSSNWPQVTLKDVTSILGDGLHGTPEYEESGEYYFINGNNLNNGNIIITENTKRASKSEYEKHKKDLNDRTILVSINGTLGNIAFYNGEKVFLGKSACYFNVKPEVDKHYIRYVLESELFQNYIHNLATGSTIKNVSLKLMRDFSFKLPPKGIQKNISRVLKDLDDKIQTNIQTNQTLEQIAQAIFKSWFVDFDPVKAKMTVLDAGGTAEQAELAAMSVISAKSEAALKQLQAEQPEAYAELAQTASLFPAAMVDSESGEIPEGWDMGAIEDVVQFSTKRLQVSELSIENYISTENMLENKKGITKASSIPSGGTVPEFNEGDILVSNIRPYFKKIWLAKFKGGRSPDVLGFSCIDKDEIYFAYNLLYQDSFFEYMMTTSKGAKMPRGDKDAIKLFNFPLPQKELRIQYSKKVRAFYPWIKNSTEQIDELQILRDTLLPKLVSGELIGE